MRWLLKLERCLMAFGLLMLSMYVAAWVHHAVLSTAAVDSFQAAAFSRGQARMTAPRPMFAMWSPQRIRDYENRISQRLAPPIALLRIPKVDLQAPLFEDTDNLTLNRGVGRIAGTAKPEENGNIGVAGHRDSFFRVLKNVSPGDVIELVTLRQTRTYVVDRIIIIDPEDTSILAPQKHPSLTLVTCYPFYFVGSAPQRYVVQASIRGPDEPLAQAWSSQAPAQKTDVVGRWMQ